MDGGWKRLFGRGRPADGLTAEGLLASDLWLDQPDAMLGAGTEENFARRQRRRPGGAVMVHINSAVVLVFRQHADTHEGPRCVRMLISKVHLSARGANGPHGGSLGIVHAPGEVHTGQRDDHEHRPQAELQASRRGFHDLADRVNCALARSIGC